MTPEHARAYIRVSERNFDRANWKWRSIRANVPMDKIPEPATPPNQEDHVFLQEILCALRARRNYHHGRSKEELIERFLLNCDGERGGPGWHPPISLADKSHVKRTRDWLRAWARANA